MGYYLNYSKADFVSVVQNYRFESDGKDNKTYFALEDYEEITIPIEEIEDWD